MNSEVFFYKDDKILEEELLLQARRLLPDDLRKLIAQAKALADLEKNKKR
jgi:hypothetical protein